MKLFKFTLLAGPEQNDQFDCGDNPLYHFKTILHRPAGISQASKFHLSFKSLGRVDFQKVNLIHSLHNVVQKK